jgi:hypothetical protein
MKTIQIEYPESIPTALNLPFGSFVGDTRLALAIKPFELGRLSSGQAAALAGTPRVTFLYEFVKVARHFFSILLASFSHPASDQALP